MPEHLLENGGGGFNIQAFARALMIVGIPGAIAIFLVWVGAQELPRLSGLVQETNLRLTRLEEHRAESDERYSQALSRILRVVQRSCANTAKTNDDRERCYD